MKRDKIFHLFGDIGRSDLNYGRYIIQSFLSNAFPYGSVLDLGAGKGDDLLMAKSACGRFTHPVKFYALESYDKYVEILRSHGVEVFNFDIERERFPFDDECMDVIIMNQVMEHVKEVFWILHEVSRVLKTNGHFIVGIPNLAFYIQRLLLLTGEQPSCIKNYSAHVRGYTKGDFIRLIQSGFEGYQLNGFRGSGFRPFPMFLAKPLARLFPTLSESIFFDFQKTKNYNNNGYLKYPVEQQLETKFHLVI